MEHYGSIRYRMPLVAYGNSATGGLSECGSKIQATKGEEMDSCLLLMDQPDGRKVVRSHPRSACPFREEGPIRHVLPLGVHPRSPNVHTVRHRKRHYPQVELKITI